MTTEDKPGALERILPPVPVRRSADDSREGSAELMKVVSELLSKFPSKVEKQWFHNQSVTLDGYRFNHCRFDRCILNVSKGNFLLDRCFMYQCTFQYGDDAQRVLQTYSLIDGTLADRWPYLSVVKHADGTFSIV